MVNRSQIQISELQTVSISVVVHAASLVQLSRAIITYIKLDNNS